MTAEKKAESISQAIKQLDTTGGYKYDFLEVPEDYVCPICLHVLRSPHLTSCCGQHFCQSCLERLQKDWGPCPVCQASSFTVFLDKFFLRKVNQLKLICPLGCQKVVELGSVGKHTDPEMGDCTAERPCANNCGLSFPSQRLQEHYHVCPKRPTTCKYCHSYQGTHDEVTKVHWAKCPKYPMPCPMCSAQHIQHGNLDKHYKKCPQRPYTCQYCRSYQSTYVQVKDVHWCQCSEFPLPCPNGCSSNTILRKNMEQHQQVCPAELVDCDYKNVGCSAKVKRGSMAAHCARETHSHLQLMDADYRDMLYHSLQSRQWRQLAMELAAKVEALQQAMP